MQIRDSLSRVPTLLSASRVHGVDVQQHSTTDEMPHLRQKDPVLRGLPLNNPT